MSKTARVVPKGAGYAVLKHVFWGDWWKTLVVFDTWEAAEACREELHAIITEARSLKGWRLPRIGSMGRRWARRYGKSVEHRFYVESSDGLMFGPATREQVDKKKAAWIRKHHERKQALAERRDAFEAKYGSRGY